MLSKIAALRTLPLAVLLAIAPTSTAWGTIIATAWLDRPMERRACLGRARDVLYSTGFTENVQEVGNESVFGTSGSYMATVRCISEKNLVFFAVAGPNGLVSDMVTNIRYYF